jgi:nucleoside-diphosphate-sugar epimerase
VKILVTGSAGFIGSHYTERAMQDSIVTGIDRADCTDVEYAELPDCDAVVHMAATNGTKLFYEKPTEILINDSRATFRIVERYQDTGTKIVFTSSCEIFNGAIDLGVYSVPTDEAVPIMFDDITNPRWSYSLPKAMGENLIANSGNPWLVIRYFNVYGPRQRIHFIDEFVSRALAGEYYIIGNETRSFCYVDDAVEMTHQLVKKESNQIVNVGNQHEVEISTVAKLILNTMGIDPNRLKILPSRKGSVSRRCPDTALVRKLTGFSNYTPLEIGIKKTIESLL